MNTLFKIAVISIMVIGLSTSAQAAAATQDGTTKVLTFVTTTSGGTLTFTPSANTLLAATSTATTYSIGSASSKTDDNNGLEYGMTQGFNGYYQTPGGGAAPTITDFSSWTKMGGGS